MLSIVLLAYVFVPGVPAPIKLSFYLVIIIWSLILWDYLVLSRYSIAHGVVITFVLLFYILAPLIQLTQDTEYLVNTMKLDESIVIKTNLLIALFCVFYILAYKLYQRNLTTKSGYSDLALEFTFNRWLFGILLAISVLAVPLAIKEAIGLVSNFSFLEEESVDPLRLIRFKFFFMFPFVLASYYLISRSKREQRSIFLIVVLILLVMATKNFILDRRNALGPVYLSLVFFGWPRILKNNLRIFGFWVMVLVILFPLSSLLTHAQFDNIGTVEEDFEFTELIGSHFSDLHYDAWSNIPAAIDYTDKNGFQNGSQITGGLLFFVPRSIWNSKPNSSGQLLGDYLINSQFLWFNNISATIVLEGYLDFGVWGVLLFGAILGFSVVRLDVLLYSRNPFAKIFAVYAAVFLFYLMRGSLLTAIAYLSGAYMAIMIMPVLMKFFRLVNKTYFSQNQ